MQRKPRVLGADQESTPPETDSGVRLTVRGTLVDAAREAIILKQVTA